MGVDAGDRRGVDRLTIQEAARRLGISEGAVRKRVIRNSLQHEKDDDGRVYVYLDAGGRQGVNRGQDEGVDPNSSALIPRLESEVAFLRDQVHRQQEIIAQQAVTMRQLTAAAFQEATKAAETAEEKPKRAEEPRSGTEGAQTVSEYRSVDDPPRLRWHVVGVILSMLVSTFGYFLSTNLVPGYWPGSSLQYWAASLLILPLVVIPAFFGFQLGRKVRSRRFWRHLVAVGALIVLGNFSAFYGAKALELLTIPAASFYFHNFSVGFDVEGTIVLSVTPGLAYISAAVLGNAIQRRNRERLVEQRPGGFPPESASAAQRWTPQQQAIVGLAGTILSALIGLIGTILTVLASGNGG